MDNKKGDFYYAGKAIENINAISTYIQNITYEEFISNIQLLDAIMFRFVQLIENIKNMENHSRICIPKFLGEKLSVLGMASFTNMATRIMKQFMRLR